MTKKQRELIDRDAKAYLRAIAPEMLAQVLTRFYRERESDMGRYRQAKQGQARRGW